MLLVVAGVTASDFGWSAKSKGLENASTGGGEKKKKKKKRIILIILQHISAKVLGIGFSPQMQKFLRGIKSNEREKMGWR